MNRISVGIISLIFVSFLFSDAAHSRENHRLTSPNKKTDTTRPPLSAEVLLGKKLFHDVRLSGDNSISCSSCHDVSNGGDDGLRTPIGINQAQGAINTPTVFNSAYSFAQFWDGRVKTLEEQVSGPIHNPIEMNSHWEQILSKLKKDRALVSAFKRAYEQGLSEESITHAIASYERELSTHNSPYDRYQAGDINALSENAKKGHRLFNQLGCSSCHQGKNLGGNLFQYFGIMGNYFLDRGNITDIDYGRFNITKREEDRYKFKVPSLRNIAQTAPYFHDGSAETLQEAIRIMAFYQLGRSLEKQQIEQLSAFLNSLTGTVREDLL